MLLINLARRCRRVRWIIFMRHRQQREGEPAAPRSRRRGDGGVGVLNAGAARLQGEDAQKASGTTSVLCDLQTQLSR